ncbi:MAG: ABC transporter permease, partial [Candidatus Micrarchaeota archaeon]|nr:ABC transporter permease [Candidatus Micrarchaeota archaeon]
MKLKTAATFATDALRRDSLRSALTLLGIFLGLFTAVMILGVGKGIILEVQDLIGNFGTDKIMIMPFNMNKIMQSRGGIPTLSEFKESDIRDIRGITCVEETGEMIYGAGTNVQYGDKTTNALVIGITPSYYTMFGSFFEVAHGRIFNKQETSVVMLGYAAANDFFNEEILPGKKLIIANRTFTVVGTMKSIGYGSTTQHDDEIISIPLKEAEEIFNKQGKRD